MDTSKTIDIGGRFNLSLNVDVSDNLKEIALNTKHRIKDITNNLLNPISSENNNVIWKQPMKDGFHLVQKSITKGFLET